MSVQFTVLPQDTLAQPIDEQRRIALYKPEAALKGLFFSRLAAIIGEGGPYRAWRDYPQAEYARMTYVAARKVAPDQPMAEALRRLARDDFATFAAEPTGKLALTFVRSPESLLTTLPNLYKLVLKGGTLHVIAKSSTGVELEYRDYFGQGDCYIVGQLEGMVRHYNLHPRVDVRMERYDHIFYKVAWSDHAVPDDGRVLSPPVGPP